MHDVLAHRLSMISLQAGALELHPDLARPARGGRRHPARRARGPRRAARGHRRPAGRRRPRAGAAAAGAGRGP
ncbi:hypothetical protein ACQP2F_11535 [Actinoplanes sp. CA-030573]|uniref:hypothetical protein n=1 Tax=Actinoplanes sp. CA-030573 TaxID=3239898 RepID=UPI003D92B899